MKPSLKNKGYTLLEMLVVLGIFAVMTSITVFNYNKFRSETILTNMAYEVALSVREAQIYGVSVRSPNGQPVSQNFQYPYGIHFNLNSDTYYLFADSATPQDGIATCPGSECVTPYTLQRGITVTNLSIRENLNLICETNKTSLDISFRRPNPEALFDNDKNLPYAEIELTSPEGDIKYVLIRGNGQIEVKRASLCNPLT